MTLKIEARHLYRIFGKEPDRALALLRQGQDKDSIYAETGQVVGVNDVSFSVEQGEIFVIMGLSGSGKSTLVRMLNGLIKPSAGEIIIDGVDVASCSDSDLRAIRRDKISMVFQHFALFPHKTVAENVAFGLKIKGVGLAERRDRALGVLEQVGLAARADSFPRELSGGMQQRVGLARALASDPEVLLMDEPFGALDPLIRRDMQDELLDLQKRLKKTIIFITHDLHEALLLGTHIAVMRNGRFVQVGTPEQIVGEPSDDYVAAFTQDVDRSRVLRARSAALPIEPIDMALHPELAMARMIEMSATAVPVFENGRMAGLLTWHGATGALRKGETDLRKAIVADYPSTSIDSKLDAVMPLASSELPVVLIGADGRPEGLVTQQSLLGKLSEHH